MTATAAVTVDLSLPAIPHMVEALATSLSKGQQIVGIFMIGMALGQIPAGLASDRFGRIPALYSGLALFVVAATIAAMANSIDVMLWARFAQGIGASSAIVISRAILRDISSGKELARLMALLTMIFTAAPVIAPTIGALLVTQWGWRAPFVGIAVCSYALVAGVRMNLVETHTPDRSENPLRQLLGSFREFFSHRQSVFSFLLLVSVPAGFMSVIAISSALVVEIYGFTLQQYGLIFACAGLSILAGSGREPGTGDTLRRDAAGVAWHAADFSGQRAAHVHRLGQCGAILVAMVRGLPVYVYDRFSDCQRHRSGA